MYRIRLPSGREAEFTSIEELALALRRGDVSRDALIYHRRSDQWVPIEQHPRFQGQLDEADTPEQSAPPAPTPAEPAQPAEAPKPERPPTEPEPPQPVAPTPYPVRPPSVHAMPAPPPPAPAHAAPPAPVAADATRVARRDEPPRDPAAPRSGIWRKLGRLFLAVAVGGGAYFAWGRWGEQLLTNRAASAPGFEAAPPPSTLIRETPVETAPAPTPAAAAGAARSDPRAPVTAGELTARHAATVADSRQQLAAEMETIGFPSVFSAVSFASPLGARSARRRLASALNVIGQFHRRSVLLDQAYGDTANFQVSRAGWRAADREAWDSRPSLREPYAAADLAESLLADADSLLAILGGAPEFELREDTLRFTHPALTAAYDAQRRRLLERTGPPVDDFDRRPTLFLVRRSLDPARLPVTAP